MFKILSKIDIFSIKPKFFIFKEKSVSSKLGTVLTLIQISISIFITIFIFNGFFNRENFITSFTQDTMQYYKFNQSDIPFFITIYDYQAQPFQLVEVEKYLVFDVEYLALLNSKESNNKVIRRNFQLEKCNLSNNLENYSNLFKGKISIDSSLCLPQKENNLSILGTFGDFKGFSQIKIRISKCVNSKQNNNCYNIDKINNFLKNYVLVWGTIDFDIDHKIIDNPFVSKVITEGVFMSPGIFKSIKLKRKKISYISDFGFFYKTRNILEEYKFDFSLPIIEDFLYDDPSGNYFMNFEITTSGKQDNYNRHYQKIQEALAGAFSILGTMRTLFFLIVEMFYDKIYFQKLINQILKSDEFEINEQKINKLNYLKNSFYNKNNLKENHCSNQQEYMHNVSGKM